MRRVKLSDELKEAIRELPEKEKDKLLFRLIPTNPKLVERLIFDLLEVGDSKEDRRQELEEGIKKSLVLATNAYYSPGYLMMDLRGISGMITRHVQATKDKYGEIHLNLLMLIQVLELCGEKIRVAPPYKARNLNKYIINRSLKILKQISKMHPDLHLDFLDNLNKLGHLIGGNPQLMKTAIYTGLDVNWLISGEIPTQF